jgi:hypothetical protein
MLLRTLVVAALAPLYVIALAAPSVAQQPPPPQPQPPGASQQVEPATGCPGDAVHVTGEGVPPNVRIHVYFGSRAIGLPVIGDVTSSADGTYEVTGHAPEVSPNVEEADGVYASGDGVDLASDWSWRQDCGERPVTRRLANTGSAVLVPAALAALLLAGGAVLLIASRRRPRPL